MKRLSKPILFLFILLSVSCGPSRKAAAPPKAAPEWMELPVIPADRMGDLHYSYMEIEGKVQRNYSYLFEKDNLVSSWVAYPLTRENIGDKIKRTNTWDFDPLLPQDEQQNLFRGYREGNNGWYSRGHQIASADRLYSAECNATTFRFTNMTPQDSDFNGGIWNTLEIKVRDWARKCDTLYVVTGCITEDSEYYALDNVGKRVAVPTAYYKALLAYKAPSTDRRGNVVDIGHQGWSGCAFFMPHEGEYPDGRLDRKWYISIDAAESLTGVDFFPLLEKKLGKKTAILVEAEDPVESSWWR